MPPATRPHLRTAPDTAPDTSPRTTRWFRHPWRIAAAVFVLIGVAVLVGGYLWVSSEADPSGPPGSQVIVTVKPGTGVNQLASSLSAKGVIGSSLAYRIWGQFHSIPGVLVGFLRLRQEQQLHRRRRRDRRRSQRVPPGRAGRLHRAGGGPAGRPVAGPRRSALRRPGHSGTLHSPWQPVGSTNLDGLLGTGDYVVVPGETDSQLLTVMIDRFDTEADAVGLTAGSAALGLTPYQVITIASIVEKEGVIAKNLGPVARVILNRLHNDMPLQMDSTVLYAEGRDGGTVTATDLQTQTPYNTYLNKGLTPTPICFPSRAALQAALDPPSGSWLYFVVVEPDGTEAFADTYAQQLANEALAKQRGLP